MKAIVLRQFGGPEHLHLEESYPDPRPGRGEVLIEVKACGVCYHDLIARRGSLGGIPPMILGHEAVGTVIEIGPGVTTFAVGDRAATLQRMNCGACALCKQGRISLCKTDRRFFGEEIAGGYATLMTAPVLGLVHVPTELPWADAAVVSCTTGTAVHVCKTRGRIRDGETVLVTGASGGVGLQAVRLCTLLGATVIAVTSSPEKVPVLEAAGAKHVIVAKDLDFTRDVKRITSGEGVDVALEIVGSACFEHTMKCIAPGGRLVVVGNLDTATFGLNPGLVIVKELEIIGAYATTHAEAAFAFDLHVKGHIPSSVTDVLPFTEAAHVHTRLENREITGRAVLVPS